MRTWPTPTHLERCGSASIEPARRGFEPHQSGAAYLALCCHTYAAMRNRGNKQKAYVQASFLLSRRDDHHERDWAGPGTRGHQARRTRRVVADDELRPLPCRRPHWRQPAPGGPALPNALSQIQDRRPCRGSLAEGLSTGHPDMPEFVFAAEDVGAITDYLQSIQQQ